MIASLWERKFNFAIAMMSLAILSSCKDLVGGDFNAPRQVTHGCYGDGSNEIVVSADSLTLNGREFSYELEILRGGSFLRVPLAVASDAGLLYGQPADDNFFRLTRTGGAPVLVVFDQQAVIYELSHGAC